MESEAKSHESMGTAKSLVSAAIFSPQHIPPTKCYLTKIRASLLEEKALRPLLDALLCLPATFQQFANSKRETVISNGGQLNVESFVIWIKTGESTVLETSMSGTVTLPLLFIIQMVQYVQHLQKTGICHSTFVSGLRAGGVQGHCLGLLTAVVVSTSLDEQELAINAAAAVRIALGIGIYGDLGENSSDPGPTAIGIRFNTDNDEVDAIMTKFPDAHISSVVSPHMISIVAPSPTMHELLSYAKSQRLHHKMLHIRSKLHNPENERLAKELIACCEMHGELQLPSGESLQVAVRSNKTGQILDKASTSLTAEVINTILVYRCEWALILDQLSLDLQRTRRKNHDITIFGLGVKVPLAPFQARELNITEIVAPLSRTTNPPSKLSILPPQSVAIIGASCRLPGADNLEELWNVVHSGESRAEGLRNDRFNLQHSFRASHSKEWLSDREFYGNFIRNVEAFDNTFFNIGSREAKYMDPQQRLLLMAAFEAMDSSGYMKKHRRENGDAVGCFIGASYTEYLENTSAYSPSAFTATGTIRAFLSGKISHYFGWTGPSEVIDTACSASLVAIHRACQAIRSGECSMALAGGVNVITGLNNFFDLGKAGFLSPTGQCKPFDKSADGYCRADGVGLVVLKDLSRAINDGDSILGVITASCTNQGGLGSTSITVPDSIAQRTLYQTLLQKAGIDREDVTYVETHGTGTQVGDPIEIDSIRSVFGGPNRGAPVYIGSVKANIGHSETAAGVAGLLKVLMMFAHGVIPSLPGFTTLNPKIPALEPDGLCIPTNPLQWIAERRTACVNSYGASGSNSALLCSEWPIIDINPSTVVTEDAETKYPILLTAASPESLQAYARDLAAFISRSPSGINVKSLAFTLSERRKHHQVRWCTMVTSLSSLVQQLQPEIQKFAEVPTSLKRVILVFSGQSKTNIGLKLCTLQEFPHFLQHIVLCNEILKTLGCADIMLAITQSKPISNVIVLQCGTFAVQYATAKCWIDSGVKVDGIVGHSFGELTALAVSGVLSLTDALSLVYHRAKLINSHWGPERGSMLAVHANVDIINDLMDTIELETAIPQGGLEIACYNNIASHVLVGTECCILRAENTINTIARFQNLRYQRVDVSHGFHSKFTEPLLHDLFEHAKTLSFRNPSIPLQTTLNRSINFNNFNPSYVVEQSRESVYFVQAVKRLEAELGPCIWLEAGQYSPIIAMVKKAVSHPELHTFQTSHDPASSTTVLWEEGMPHTYWGFLSPKRSSLNQIWLPPYHFSGSRHWIKHIDNAIEAQIGGRDTTNQKTYSEKIPKLVSYEGSDELDSLSHRFRIHTTTERFKKIVTGHAVRRKALCPASMYMECAAMGALMLDDQLAGKPMCFRSIVFHRGLSCNNNDHVQLQLKSCGHDDKSWRFSVRSSSKVLHAEGNFYTSSHPDFDMELYPLLVASQMASLENNLKAERLLTRRAYSLFSNVVDYAPLLQGISSIIIDKNHALAQIKVPFTKFLFSESTMSSALDAISLDTFIQVLGLLINSSSGSSSDKWIYIATAIDKMVVLPCDFRKTQTWTVYATFSSNDDEHSSGAIFVFSEAGELMVTGSGIRFVRIEAVRLERLLKATNPQIITENCPSECSLNLSISAKQRSTDILYAQDTDYSFCSARPKEPISFREQHEEESNVERRKELQNLIAAYTGLRTNLIQNDESFSSMGLDSLAVIELAEELNSKFGIDVDTETLLTSSVSSLLELLNYNEFNPRPVIDIVGQSTTSASTAAQQTPSNQRSYTNESKQIHKWKRPKHTLDSRHSVETKIYKEVDGVEICADIFVPLKPPSSLMPIALMIHGGGHMTLSRKAVRPAQTAFLLAHGILPISLDYRLCPQVDLISGPMTDVRDAVEWAQSDVPTIMREKGIIVDASKIVIIGWSTGGTLAMSTAWTTALSGLKPPVAILGFYYPTNYDPLVPRVMGKELPTRTMSMSAIQRALPDKPVSSHAPSSMDSTSLGWIQTGDPRSELVLALVKEANGMSLLFNGIPAEGELLPYTDTETAASASPLAQVLTGNYCTATFIIIGEEDEIVPVDSAILFINAMKAKSITNGIITIPKAKHIHDLGLTPEDTKWKQEVEPGYDFIFKQLEL